MMEEKFTLAAFLKDRRFDLVLLACCLAFSAVFLSSLGLAHDAVAVVCALIGLLFAIALATDYLRKRAFYRALEQAAVRLHNAKHLGAFLSEPAFLDGRLAYQAIGFVCRLSAEETAALQEDAKNYRDYIELWIHEVKTPLAATKLMLARMRGLDAFALKAELERIEMQVENALFYVRSTSVTNDYRIAETDLRGMLQESCKKNAGLLVERGVSVHLDQVPEGLKVLTDAAWTSFVVGQVLANAAKYGAASIAFSAAELGEESSQGQTILEIQDDGRGIPAADVPRVFDRGFVGANGRTQGSATGMGLYLCALMCQRMGLGLSLSSEEGVGTTVRISFPHARSRMGFLTEA